MRTNGTLNVQIIPLPFISRSWCLPDIKFTELEGGARQSSKCRSNVRPSASHFLPYAISSALKWHNSKRIIF